MFSRKSQRISQLEQHLLEAHQELARTKSSPYFHIAESIAKQAREGIDELDLEQAVQSAITAEREKLRAQFIGGIVAKQVKERLEDEKDEIRRQAEIEAAREAEKQLEEFRASQGPAILEETTANLRKTKFRSLVEQEKAALRAQALEDLRAMAVQTAAGEFANEDPRVDKEYNKARAAEIRKITKRTRLLDLTSLQSDDLLEVVFVKKGNGNESYTEGDGWGNSYERTDLITRRITLRMTDCSTGSALIEEDSWLNDKTKAERSLAPMTPVRGVCVNPVDHQTVPGVYKAAPLYLLRNGTDVMGSDHEVWYATLNDYKALS